MRKISAVAGATIAAVSMSLTVAPAVAEDDQLNNQEQQGEATGSLGNLTDQLNTANDALHGPVALERNEEGQLVVTYTNETPKEQYCSGIAMPFDSVQRHGLDQVDPADVEAMKLVGQLQGVLDEGNSAVFAYTLGLWGTGKPDVKSGPGAGKYLLSHGLQGATGANYIQPYIQPGESQTWTMDHPDKDAAAIVVCDGKALTGKAPTTYQGIEESVLFNQLKDKLGPLGSATDLSVESDSLRGSVVGALPGLVGSLSRLDSSSLRPENSGDSEDAEGEDAPADAAEDATGAE